nr:MAG TPA: hypothetical protein [Caudoviricetes sp.]
MSTATLWYDIISKEYKDEPSREQSFEGFSHTPRR